MAKTKKPMTQAEWAKLYDNCMKGDERERASEFIKVRRENLLVLRALRTACTVWVQKMIARKSVASPERELMLAQALAELGRSEAFWLGKKEP